jgi:plasmid maintenance system antidote protein VapI
MILVRFRELVAAEFARRQGQNPRYSLRGFARLLGINHSTISRLLKSTRPVPSRTVNALGPRLGLSAGRITAIVADEDAAALIHCIQRKTFRPDSRWLASAAGISIDRVNVALQLLIRTRRLEMPSASQWLVTESGNR